MPPVSPPGLKYLTMIIMKILFALNGLAFIAWFSISALNQVNPSLFPAVWIDYCAIAWAVIALMLALYIIIILLD